MKTCINRKGKGCLKQKPLIDFGVNKRNKDGLATFCKECTKTNRRKHYEDNLDQVKAKAKDYYTNNLDAVKEYRQGYYKENSEAIAIKAKVYADANRDKVNSYAASYVEANKDLLKAKAKVYRQTDRYKALNIVNNATYRARKMAFSDGSVTLEALQALRLKQANRCHHCSTLLSTAKYAVHLDHLIPLIEGGTHILANVAWSCATCNTRKGRKLTYVVAKVST